MKNIISILLLLLSFNVALAQKKDTIEYRAQIWAEVEDIKRYGGEKTFWFNMQQMFDRTNFFFNESENKFKYYFKFVPVDLKIYDIQGDKEKYKTFEKQAYGTIDTARADFVVFFALNAEKSGLWCGGGGKSGQSVVCSYQTLADQKIEGGIFGTYPPKQGTYSNLGHEFGHVRGASDIYQLIIDASDNPVNHKSLMPQKCNMGNGMWAWSDYCSALFNYTAKHTRVSTLGKDWIKATYPDKLKINVSVKGKPKKNVTVKLYGTRAGGSKNNRDVYPIPYRTYKTDKYGNIEILDVYKLYRPDPNDPDIPPKEVFPYWYWFSFLVEAEYEGKKEYCWLIDWDTQISKFNGSDIHLVDFKF